MSLALGPLGRNGEASGSLNTNGKVAAMCVQIPFSSPNCSDEYFPLQVQLFENPRVVWRRFCRRLCNHGTSRCEFPGI
jgi:hypothetical protein